MEDDPDDLDNIFDEYESTSRQDGEENVINNENPISNEENPPQIVPVPRVTIRRPRLKFNPDRLCGERGIPILVKHFKDVKFKGKGHEKEDLNKLMTSLTHWCHRLFPSMKFDDCLRQIEKLGKKRPVQTCLHKIRKDMPILNSDFVSDEVEREEEQNEPDEEPVQEDAFDRLFNAHTETSASNFSSTHTSKESSGNVLGSTFGSTLTEEQRKRMEYNRLLAAERRRSKLDLVQSAQLEITDNDRDQGLPSSESQRVDLDSNRFEETSHSVIKSPAQNLDTQTQNVEEKDQIAITKDSEELGMDELMDLVEDEDQSILNENDRSNDFIVNNQTDSNEKDEVNTGNSVSKSPVQGIDSEINNSQDFENINVNTGNTEDHVADSEHLMDE